MEANVVKNVLNTVVHFLETKKHIDLQDDPGNDLELFLKEFNRYREIIGLPIYEVEKRMRMTGRGDWFGQGEKVRFVEATPKTRVIRAESGAAQITKSEKTKKPAKITKTKLKTLLSERYSDLKIDEIKEKGKPVTVFKSQGETVGFWSKGKGWGLTRT